MFYSIFLISMTASGFDMIINCQIFCHFFRDISGKNSGKFSSKYYNYMKFQDIIIKREVSNFLSLDTELRKVILRKSG